MSIGRCELDPLDSIKSFWEITVGRSVFTATKAKILAAVNSGTEKAIVLHYTHSEMELETELNDRVVRVYWALDKTWLTGKIDEYDPLKHEHKINYTDGLLMVSRRPGDA